MYPKCVTGMRNALIGEIFERLHPSLTLQAGWRPKGSRIFGEATGESKGAITVSNLFDPFE